MKSRSGPQVYVGVPEALRKGVDDGDIVQPTGIWMEIGGRDDLSRQTCRRMASEWKKLVAQNPTATMRMISIGGYDDDPRELWEIPEVARYIRRWAKLTGLNTPEAALDTFGGGAGASTSLLGSCGVFTEKE